MLVSKCCEIVPNKTHDAEGNFFGAYACSKCQRICDTKDTLDDYIDKPAHYAKHDLTCKCGNVIKCLELTETYNFRLASALKYIIRCNDKRTKEQDLNKAIFYLKRELEKSGLKYEGDK